jgi:hypothetical protein
VVLEEVSFVLESRSDTLGLVDISLTSIDNGNIAQSQGDNSSGQNVDNVGSLVPIELRLSDIAHASAEMFGAHIKSTLVKTPIVRVPSGSTSRANFKPSEFAKSVLAAVTAKMMAFGLEIYFTSMSLICRSMSRGWSPTGTLVRPGKSTKVKVKTLGEKIRKLMGLGEIP